MIMIINPIIIKKINVVSEVYRHLAWYSLLRVDGARIALTPNLRSVEFGQPVCGDPGLLRLGWLEVWRTERSALASNARDGPHGSTLSGIMLTEPLEDKVLCMQLTGWLNRRRSSTRKPEWNERFTGEERAAAGCSELGYRAGGTEQGNIMVSMWKSFKPFCVSFAKNPWRKK